MHRFFSTSLNCARSASMVRFAFVAMRAVVLQESATVYHKREIALSYPFMASGARAAEDPAILAQLAFILASNWDPAGVVRDALEGGATFYTDQGLIIAAMLAADARETEVQRYLRQLEQRVGSVTLHPAEARHAIAVALWHAGRQL
jgi:hypothetical protein